MCSTEYWKLYLVIGSCEIFVKYVGYWFVNRFARADDHVFNRVLLLLDVDKTIAELWCKVLQGIILEMGVCPSKI